MANLTRSHRHEVGIGRVAYTPDGGLLYSAGSEGLLRVFSAKPEDEGKEQLALIDYHESSVLAMDASVGSLWMYQLNVC
jgi:WD40 repeat protein